MNLSLVQCQDKPAWDRFVKLSPQGSIFSSTDFLESLQTDYELWWVEEEATPKLGAIVLKDRSGQPIRAPHGLTQYQGILLDPGYSRMQVHRRVGEVMRVVDFLLAALQKHHRRISFCLHPGFEDLRSFSWFNYHNPEAGHFRMDLKYSGLIGLHDSADFEAYLQSVRENRQREYRKARKQEMTVEASADLDILKKLYQLTFERQNISLSDEKVQLALNIARLAIAHEYGDLLLCRDSRGEAIAATLFLFDESCGYYLIGANHPDYRQTGSGTFLLLENIRRCISRGLKYVDVCGMNSPNRGDFKASLNAIPVPYFVVTWESRLA